MKPIILGLLLAASVATAQPFTTTSYTNTPAALLPDNDPSGLASSFVVSGLAGVITNIQVTLDITGGFNGDLYAYLVSPTGQLVVLLNRSGVSASSTYGYGDAGLNITLDSTAGLGYQNIHDYQTSVVPGSGSQLTGIWAPDGRNLDPASAGSVFDATSPSTALSDYFGADPNGTWRFFIADLSLGGQSTVQSVALNIVTAVPEPQTWGLVASGLVVALLAQRRQLLRK